MQVENDKNYIKTLSFGCRLNALECEKIKNMLAGRGICAVVVNTCSVTAEAERQCGQVIRKIARENPGATIFITGCAASCSRKTVSRTPATPDASSPHGHIATMAMTVTRTRRGLPRPTAMRGKTETGTHGQHPNQPDP